MYDSQTPSAAATAVTPQPPPPPVGSKPIWPSHLADLRASGIPESMAVALDLWSATDADVQRILGRTASVGGGLVIPYFDLGGKPLTVPTTRGPVPYVRVRLDDPARAATPRDPGGAKYLSRRGSGQFPFVTPRLSTRLLAGVVDEVILTEGEKKAMKGEVEGLDVIGLPGNWGWKRKESPTLHPFLEQLVRPGMAVTVVWDSDAAMNTAFAASTRMLHGALRDKGCPVRVVVLPQEGRRKTGLDDYLLNHSVAEFRALVDATPALDPGKQPRTDELIVGWLPALRGALQSLPEGEARDLVMRNFAKGWIDGVGDELRVAVVKQLDAWANWDVDAAFYVLAERTAMGSRPASDAGEDEPGDREVTPEAGAGDEVQTPDRQRACVVRVDRDLLWVTDVSGPRGRSRPVLACGVRVIRTGGAGARKLPAADLADLFLAERFARGGAAILRSYRGAFYAWRQGTYRELDAHTLSADAMAFLRGRSRPQANVDTLNNTLANLRAADLCHVPTEARPPVWLDEPHAPSADGLIALSNGILDFEALLREDDDEHVFLAPTPRLFTLTGLPVGFDESAECTNWLHFLQEVLPDVELRELVQEFVGYLLLPDTRLQRMMLLVGSGANGKGVLMSVITALLGPHNVCSVSLAKFSERFSLWPLTTCLLNAVAELPTAEAGPVTRIAEDKLKAIVSGDAIEVERKNRDPLTVRPTARLMFAANELPVFTDRSEGIWRRSLMVPFDVTVEPDRQDPDLAAELVREELPGIFNWALAGRLRLVRRGSFHEPEACRRMKAAHRLACAHEDEFLADHCTVGDEADFLPTEAVYAAYRVFCAAAGYRAIGKTRFVQALQRRFPAAREDRRRVNRAAWPSVTQDKPRGWGGVRFHPDGIDDVEVNQ